MNQITATMPALETRVKLYHDASGGGAELLGFAELIIGGAFVIHGIRILMGKANGTMPAGPFIAFPSRKGSGSAEGRYFDVASPITPQARQMASETILGAYREAASKTE